MKNKENLLSEKTRQYAQTNLELLDKKRFIIGDYMGNYKCHFNAVHRATIDKKLDVILVLTFSGDGQPIIHFINTQGKKYIDNTWGYQYEWSDYYLLKEISKEEFSVVGHILHDARKEILAKCFNWLERRIWRIRDQEI